MINNNHILRFPDEAVSGHGTNVETTGYRVSKSYLGKQLIFPITGRKPGENTLAYYPLTQESLLNDLSGNNRTLTKYGTVDFGTYAGVSCAYMQSRSDSYSLQNALYTDAIALPTNMTISIWIQTSVNKSNVTHCWCFGTSRPYLYGVRMGTYYNNGELCVGNMAGTNETIWKNLGISTGKRYNIILTKTGTLSTMYLNGALVGTHNGVASSIAKRLCLGDTYSGGGLTGYLSEVIVENEVWTVEKVQKYYNNTKSNYGIS